MEKIIGWWSGGNTSAVACKIGIDLYGKENVRIVFIDTHNEDVDTYRFMKDCADWYGWNMGSRGGKRRAFRQTTLARLHHNPP